MQHSPTVLSRRQFLLRTSGAAAGMAFAGTGLVHPFLASAEAGWKPGETAKVVDGPLNLRSGAGLEYSVKTSFSTGTRLLIGDGPIWADGYTWIYVMDAPTGWVAAEFVQKVSGGGNSPQFEVTDGPLNVRQAAGLDASILGVASTGEQGIALTQESTQADGYMWALVEFDSGLRGWIALAFVEWL